MADTEDYARTARHVMRGAATAVLSTLDRDSGAPYGSLVQTACLFDATPVLLISTLAEHTQNALADPTASILFDGTAGLEEPLTGPRVTAVGRLEPTGDDAVRERFLARHPGAAGYAGFADFGFWRLAIERAHLVAGFGKIVWIDAAELRFDASAAIDLAARETDIVDHMNADHADAIQLYADADGATGGPQTSGGWTMTGVDPEGFDLRHGADRRRLDFDSPVRDADAARAALVAMVRAARGGG